MDDKSPSIDGTNYRTRAVVFWLMSAFACSFDYVLGLVAVHICFFSCCLSFWVCYIFCFLDLCFWGFSFYLLLLLFICVCFFGWNCVFAVAFSCVCICLLFALFFRLLSFCFSFFNIQPIRVMLNGKHLNNGFQH